jgi:hypothetical protein
MSCDALMRWEWEGGTPASVSEPARAKPAENTDIGSQPTSRGQRARRVAPVSRALLVLASLARKARALAAVEVSQVVVPAAPPAESGASNV